MTNSSSTKVKRIFVLIQYLSDFPPKTAEKLAQLIDISVKTLYKDLHLIETLGYETEKDHLHRYCIKYSGRTEYHLDETEKKIIIATIKEAGISTTAVTSITQKLKSNHYPDATNIGIMKQLFMIRVLVDAIKNKTPVTIIKYKSTSSGTSIRDRVIMPIYFDEMRMSVTAYDMEIAEPRIFKVARMTDINPVTIIAAEKFPAEIPIVDTFGYAGMMDYEVSMRLTLRAFSILTEEFTQASSQIGPSDDNDFPFLYSTKVCGYEGVGRFVLGLMTEIKVVGDKGFKLYLKNKIKESTLF
jgi:proteasome accessory factor C